MKNQKFVEILENSDIHYFAFDDNYDLKFYNDVINKHSRLPIVTCMIDKENKIVGYSINNTNDNFSRSVGREKAANRIFAVEVSGMRKGIYDFNSGYYINGAYNVMFLPGVDVYSEVTNFIREHNLLER